MLLNNIDIINAMLYKGVNSLRFESSDNLAKVISQEVGGDIIAEHANLTLGTEKYRANIFELTLSVKEAEKVFANTQNLYKVLHLGEYKKGVLYSVEDIEEETIVKLLEIKK